ncbi:MAG: ABC transporter substrate-binding protein [Candidatus Dormibacteria bacterium]|jgi:peptide/nickel transport system substrate-binding protein
MSAAVSSNVNQFQFGSLLWRPLYWFGHGSNPGVNYALSVGEAPVFSNGGKTVTITLNRAYRWSNGQPVTNRDVELWMNIFFAEKENYLGYFGGSIPDDITSMSFPADSPYQFSLTFNEAYSHLFVLYDQLSQIFPIPQQEWDRTSSSGPIGNYDLTTAGAAAVWTFLNAQSSTESTYSTNPLWKTVDGPWLLRSFASATGAATFVPNQEYTGPDRPKIAGFEEVPFTSDTAEFDALRSGELDYGYLPVEDLGQKSYFTARGYKLAPWPAFGFNPIALNFTNPQVGPILSQLYIRQALQLTINQPEIVKDIWEGLAVPTYSPIPSSPPNAYMSAATSKNPYPFSLAKARKLLSDHGWIVRVNGTDTCSRAGSGATQCGAGIAKGAALALTMAAGTGSAPFTAQVESMVSMWGEVGIHVALQLKTVPTIFSTMEPCSDGGPGCSWEIDNVGEPGRQMTYSPEFLPDADTWFETGGADNLYGYSNPVMDRLSLASELNSSLQSLRTLAMYTAQQLPSLWEPDYPYQLSVISPKLHGAVPQNPNLDITPEDWTLAG